LFDSNNEIPNRCIKVRLRQDQLSRIALMEDIEDDEYIHLRPRSTYSTPCRRMDGSMYRRQSRLVRHQLGRHTLAMPVTTALKALRGWRYVALKVSNWAIAVFAGATA